MVIRRQTIDPKHYSGQQVETKESCATRAGSDSDRQPSNRTEEESDGWRYLLWTKTVKILAECNEVEDTANLLGLPGLVLALLE